MTGFSTPRPRMALITGGGTGIGASIAQAFAGDGVAVAVLDVDASAAQDTAKRLSLTGTAIGITGSITNEDDVRRAIAETVDAFGGLDILINNAGVSCNASTFDLDVAEWRRAIDINLTGAFLCAREAGREMARGLGGVILNIGSMYGTVAAPERVGYCASKAAIDMLGRVLALEWASLGIRVNTIAPGYVKTPLMDDLIARGRLDSEALLQRTPMRRFGDVSEIAELALFLVSDRASFITGQTIGIDGGWTANGYL